MARQARTAKRKAPMMAPTAMKTVPSGRVEWFMKGALLVGGIPGGGWVGITPRETVGILGRMLSVVEVLRPGSGGRVLGDEDDEDSSVSVVDSGGVGVGRVFDVGVVSVG